MASISRARAAQAVFPDEIWEEILLCLDAAADLARACAACSTIRRVVSDRRFLRRFRSLRSPAVLGFISVFGELRTPSPPHRSAPEARALERAADFTFSFLPDPRNKWAFCHACDGRVLLFRFIYMMIKIEFLDFLVCDPLYRRYVKIPPIPDYLLASAASNGMLKRACCILAPAGEDDEEESFRVICSLQYIDKVVVFVFSSCNQTWRGTASTVPLPHYALVDKLYYAHGCVHWILHSTGYSIVLDTSEMNFTVMELPPSNCTSKRAIVEAADGRLGFLTIDDSTIDLYCKNWQSNGVGTQEWLHNKVIPLPKEPGVDYRWSIEGTDGHYLALIAGHGGCNDHEWPPNSENFVLDIKTLLVEKLCTSNSGAFYGFPYARFPPPLALPSI